MQQRLDLCKKILEQQALDMLLIEDPCALYYLTGLELSLGQLWIPKKDSPCLFVDGRYIEAAGEKGSVPCALLEPNAIINYLNKHSTPRCVGFDASTTSYLKYLEFPKTAEFKPLDNPLKSLRVIKDPQELKKLEQVGALGSLGFDYVLSILKEGVRERDIAKKLEIFWLENGGDGLAFEPIIAFGENSSKPHYKTGDKALQLGDIVLIDIGVRKAHYHSDMTRTFFFGAPKSKELVAIWHIVKEAQAKALELSHPNELFGHLDQAARDHIRSQGYGPQFSHSLGHGVGLEIHEYPRLKEDGPDKDVPILPGMVFTIEPGIYLQGLGGVRLEDTIATTTSGYANLTQRKICLTLEEYGYP